jgi:hypothetical protein
MAPTSIRAREMPFIVERIGLAHTVCAKARSNVGASEGVRSEDVFVEERDHWARVSDEVPIFLYGRTDGMFRKKGSMLISTQACPGRSSVVVWGLEGAERTYQTA